MLTEAAVSHPEPRLSIVLAAKLGEGLRAEAERRSPLTLERLVHIVLRDFLTESAARRAAGSHAHCPCRGMTPDGRARCCWCQEVVDVS